MFFSFTPRLNKDEHHGCIFFHKISYTSNKIVKSVIKSVNIKSVNIKSVPLHQVWMGKQKLIKK